MLESGDHEGLWHLTIVGSGVFLVPPTGFWRWLSQPLGALLSHAGGDVLAASSHSGDCGEQQPRALGAAGEAPLGGGRGSGRCGRVCAAAPWQLWGHTDKNSKLCTRRTHTAELGDSSDPLGWAGSAGGVDGRGCNQHLQLSPAPAALKGSATKHSIPTIPPSQPSCHCSPSPFSHGHALAAINPQLGEDLLRELLGRTGGAGQGWG